MTNSKYNAHTKTFFKPSHPLKVKDIFDVQSLQSWCKFVNQKLPNYFRDMFRYNYVLHEIGTQRPDPHHLYPTHTSGARNVLRHAHRNKSLEYLIDRIKTHSLFSTPILWSFTWLICIAIIVALSIGTLATLTTESDKSIKWRSEIYACRCTCRPVPHRKFIRSLTKIVKYRMIYPVVTTTVNGRVWLISP